MLSNDEHSTGGRTFHHDAGNEGSAFTVRAGSSFPHYPLVLLCLGLLSAILLIAAVVIGIYCGKVGEGYVSQQKLMGELKELQSMQSEAMKAQEEAQRALESERVGHLQLKLQIELQKSLNDGLQSQIETLRAERTALQSNTSDLQASCGHCLPGWFLLNSSCYFYAKSAFIPKKNWPDSRADCISRGADLVVIDNWEEQEMLFEYLPKVASSSKPWWDLDEGIWIGFTDIHTERTWVWINNMTQLDGGYWIDGEPNDHGLEGEDCAAIFNRGSPRKTWFDGKCAKASEGYLQIPHSAAEPFAIELNYLRSNHSNLIKAKEEAQKALEMELTGHLQLKLQVEHQKTLNDGLQSQIETLQAERTALQSNKSAFGETELYYSS
uniref:uncharacterized protein n=1 Tax=Centroberyx gerrardi TaxID=166262 RepID=UPI003AB0D1DD